MTITKKQILNLLSDMEDAGVDEAIIDLSNAERLRYIDFDIFESNGLYLFTALTLAEDN